MPGEVLRSVPGFLDDTDTLCARESPKRRATNPHRHIASWNGHGGGGCQTVPYIGKGHRGICRRAKICAHGGRAV